MFGRFFKKCEAKRRLSLAGAEPERPVVISASDRPESERWGPCHTECYENIFYGSVILGVHMDGPYAYKNFLIGCTKILGAIPYSITI